MMQGYRRAEANNLSRVSGLHAMAITQLSPNRVTMIRVMFNQHNRRRRQP